MTTPAIQSAALAKMERLQICLRAALSDVDALMQEGKDYDDLRMTFISARLPGILPVLKSAKTYADDALHIARQLTEGERTAFNAAHYADAGFVAEAAE